MELREDAGEHLPHLAQEDVQVVQEVENHLAHDVVVGNRLDHLADALHDRKRAVDHSDVVRLAGRYQLLHHCRPANEIVLQSDLHQTWWIDRKPISYTR